MPTHIATARLSHYRTVDFFRVNDWLGYRERVSAKSGHDVRRGWEVVPVEKEEEYVNQILVALRRPLPRHYDDLPFAPW